MADTCQRQDLNPRQPGCAPNLYSDGESCLLQLALPCSTDSCRAPPGCRALCPGDLGDGGDKDIALVKFS